MLLKGDGGILKSEKIEKVEVVEISPEKQQLLNKIIAAGLNSLSYSINSGANPEKDLLDIFVSKEFIQILPCWAHLNEQVKFYIFKTHIEAFERFMKSEAKGKE